MERHEDDYEAPTVTDLGRLEDITKTAMGSGPTEMQGGKT